MLRRLLHRSIR